MTRRKETYRMPLFGELEGERMNCIPGAEGWEAADYMDLKEYL